MTAVARALGPKWRQVATRKAPHWCGGLLAKYESANRHRIVCSRCGTLEHYDRTTGA